MSLHKLAGISPSHPGSLSCLLYFLCMLAIPIFPLFKFEEFLIYLYYIGFILNQVLDLCGEKKMQEKVLEHIKSSDMKCSSNTQKQHDYEQVILDAL